MEYPQYHATVSPSVVYRETNSTYEPSRTTTHGLSGSIAVAAAIGTIVFLVACIIRMRQKRFFMARAYLKDQFVNPPNINEASGFLNWIPYVIKFPERHLLEEYGGLDAVLYVTFIKYTIYLYCAICIVGIVPLIVNITGDNGVHGDGSTSMGNITRESPRFWAHTAATVINTVLVFGFLYKYYLAESSLRTEKNQHDQDKPYSRSVLVDHIPTASSIDNETLLKDFKRIYGKEQVSTAQLIPDTEKADELRVQRNELVPQYKKAYYRFSETGEELEMKDGWKGLFGNKVNSRPLLEERIRKVDGEIIEIQSAPLKYTKTGVVTFTSVPSALLCAQTRHHVESARMKISYAPDPNELEWGNMGKSLKELRIRHIISTILIILLLLFWTIPVAFLGSFTNLETLSQVKELDWLVFIININTFVRGIIVGLLPSLVLIIFMALLPIIIRLMLSVRAYKRRSSLDRGVGFVYYIFLFIYVFLVITISGSATGALQQYINSPTSIPTELGKTIPKQALFYFNYVATNAFVTKALFILRVPGFLIAFIKTKLAKTSYEIDLANQPEGIDYFSNYAIDMMIFLCGLVYSVMTPLVSYITLVYFLFTFLAVKNFFVFVHKAPYDNVRMNKVATTGTIVSIITFLLLMIGVLAINKATGEGIVIVVTFALSIIASWYLIREYSILEDFAPLSDFSIPEERHNDTDEYYRPPALSPPPPFEQIPSLPDNLGEQPRQSRKAEIVIKADKDDFNEMNTPVTSPKPDEHDSVERNSSENDSVEQIDPKES